MKIIADEKILLKKYCVLKVIGEGGSSVVYLAEHIVLHQKRIIKCLEKTNPHSQAFLREIKFLKNLKSPNIPVLYDFEEDESKYYLIEEYIEGTSFKQIFFNEGKKYIQDIINDMIALSEIFYFLHNQKPYPVLYLDLKPEHVIVSNRGIYLVDFGAAAEKKDESVEGTCMGTNGFAAPELIMGTGIDERTDIYNLGALFYWCLTNKTAENADKNTIHQNLIYYPIGLRNFISQCLEKNIEERFCSISEFTNELKKLAIICQNEVTSYKIAVIGSQNRIGVTHFCVALNNYFNFTHRKCLYEEKTDDAFLRILCENNKKFVDENGIVKCNNFCGLPKYGQAVIMNNINYKIIIEDYGCLFETAINGLKKADICLIIGGIKEWEVEYTRKLLGNVSALGLMKKSILVLQGMKNKRFFRGEEFKEKDVFFIPYNANPFKLEKEMIHFFEELSKNIFQKKGVVDV